ncbi:hypothetical protein N7499_005812 [Penicillium canescens]|uniref:Zn(2)-C6 fungal-type domain-containing protein n=1 Tax=Penicillium canescens TaxID=5083 RepID=A0AAD6ICM1_PENCN|nr:hypothetical protein N7460_004742 [Penicillium canescens]KAJ6054862.1 hypothetical protein N7444_003960 [Penicillium canescens]KAJ6080938.1 hypothetical protein N7499_005812 [Penicillium canescens]
MPSQNRRQPRKRTKTFTGCWTCRTRKIKCDESKPCCHQCFEKGLSCEGYTGRLQWLTPVTGTNDHCADEAQGLPLGQNTRRLMPVEPVQPVLGWNQVDGILRYIDSLESVVNTRSEDVSANIQNFGVFSLQQNSLLDSVQELSHTNTPTVKPVRRPGEYEFVADPEVISLDSAGTNDYSEPEVAWDLCKLQGHDFALEFPHAVDPVIQALPKVTQTLPTDTVLLPSVGFEEIYTLAGLKYANNRPRVMTPPVQSVPNTLEDLVVPSQERFLMGHYRNRVVNIFCVIDNAKSPWKTIHLPSVLQCAGELSFGGTTTRIRNALRNSLLSISAFYFSNDLRANRRNEEAENWGTIASRYRCDAIGLLKYAVEIDLYAEEKPRYKEFLATMLSMITINVMSGDTRTCSVHLDGAEKLITHMATQKSSFSRKAQSLHRIYLYLRVIYESTSIRRQSTSGSRFASWLGSAKTVGPHPILPSINPFIEDEDTPLSMLPMECTAPLQTPSARISAYECIYGIPESLLLLLKQSIEVIDEVNHHRAGGGNSYIPDYLNHICDVLEQEIMDWPIEERLKRCKEAKYGINANIIYHQTRAFLNALIIYFSQSIRLLNHRYLRQYVQNILESIEAIEELKAETKLLAAPLFWPAFIGATEAFEARQQERFRQWYKRAEVYGMESVRTGIQVLHEVWRQGPTISRNIQPSWCSIVENTGACLMLT